MISMVDEIIAEAKETYSRMSLLELLAHENSMMKLLHVRRPDNMLKRLYQTLCSEIETRLK